MTLSIIESLETIRDKFSAFTGSNVKIALPDDSEPGLFIFPYNFAVDTQFRDIPAPVRVQKLNQDYRMSCLLVSSPPNDYMTLGKGYDCLISNPVVEANEGIIRITINAIPTEHLTGLFISGGSTCRLSIPFELACSAAR